MVKSITEKPTAKLNRAMRSLGLLYALFYCLNNTEAATFTTNNASVTWNNSAHWTLNSGTSVLNYPVAGDVVIIQANQAVTVTANAACASISWTGTLTASRTVTINAGVSLDVSGDITFNTPGAGFNRTISVLGTLNCASFIMGTSGNNAHDIIMSIGTAGTVNMTGNLVMPSAFARHHVDMVAAGGSVLNIGGNIGNAAAPTAGGGGFTNPRTINLNGTLPQNYWPGTAGTAALLKINNASGAILRLAITVTALTIGDITSNSLFKDSGNTVTCTGTLNLNNGSTYRLGRYSGTGGTATVFPAFATINIALGTTVEYAHINGNQTVSITPNYANLSFTSSVARSRVIAAGTLRVRNNLSIGTNTTFLGTTNNPLTQLGGNYTNSGTFTSGTGLFTMNGTSNQSITGTAVFTGGLTISNTGGGGANTVTLNNAITTTGNLSITNGIFNLGSFTANRTAGGGTMTISNGARLVIGGTNGLPGNYTTHAIGATSTVEYNGTTNTVTTPNSSQAYGNLVISASGATTTGTFSIAGILTVTGSLVGSAGTITMSTAASAISNSGTLTFSGLTMGATPTAQSQYNTSYSVAGTLTINVGVTFEPTSGTITMSAAGSAISNSGTTTFSNLTIAATPTAQSQYNTSYTVAGALATSGAINFSPSGGTITMSGSSGSISNASGTLAFNNLTVSGTTVSSTGNFSVVSAMSVTGVFNPAATSVISGAGTLSGSGTVNVTRTAVTPSFGAQYTIANKTLTSLTVNYNGSGDQTVSAENYGTLVISTNGTRTVTFVNGGTVRVSNVFTPTATTTTYVVTNNIFEYNGSGAQTITAFTYNNLIISNTGAKTVLAGTTVNCQTIEINNTAVLTLPDTSILNVQAL